VKFFYVEEAARNWQQYWYNTHHRTYPVWMKLHCFTMLDLIQHWKLKWKHAMEEGSMRIN